MSRLRSILLCCMHCGAQQELLLKRAAEVALEAGDSPQLIFRHDRELVTEQGAKAWFAITPESAKEQKGEIRAGAAGEDRGVSGQGGRGGIPGSPELGRRPRDQVFRGISAAKSTGSHVLASESLSS
jgi:hypothetical protein